MTEVERQDTRKTAKKADARKTLTPEMLVREHASAFLLNRNLMVWWSVIWTGPVVLSCGTNSPPPTTKANTLFITIKVCDRLSHARIQQKNPLL
ncbi:MAG: hypothetical protein ACYSWW_14005 [Planctomycetota bacterium]